MSETQSTWVVHKFGGTSVGSAGCMRKCLEIIRPFTTKNRVAIVVSAMGGKPKVTDLLLELVHAAAARREDEIATKMSAIRLKHEDCVHALLPNSPANQARIMQQIDSDLKDVSDLLRAVMLMKLAHEQILELVSGYGEVWSATIMEALMNQEGLPFKFLNARDVLFVNEDAKVYWEESEKHLSEFIEISDKEYGSQHRETNSCGHGPHLLITGYIASTMNGVATTLKRDGSDYSASIFGRMLRSESITIWTDVSGVYSADPRRVPEAQILQEVSYSEAVELAYFGAKVIHPKTMEPAIESKIPIYIRNTFEPHLEGTRIYLPSTKEVKVRERSVCGFTTVDNISLLNIEGTGMIGVPGIAHRLFGALHTDHISVMFIAQASSEHSICFATHTVYAERACEAIKHAFFYELKQGYISKIRVISDCSIIAAVGESMCQMPGVAGLFFGALGDASINVLSISQGCDERNISAVVYSRDATRALRAVHSAFWLSSLELSIGIVGTGRVGSALLQTLLENLDLLEARLGLKIKIRGVANSRKMLLGEDLTGSLREILSYFSSASNSATASASSVCSSAVNSPLRRTTTPAAAASAAAVVAKETLLELSTALFSAACTIGEPANVALDSNGALPHNRRKSRGMSMGTDVRKSDSTRSLQDLESAMSDSGDDKLDTNLELFLQHAKAGPTPHTVIVDASTSFQVSELHPVWLRARAHIVTANKRALSSSLELYNALFSEVRATHHMYMSEVTIGASLPIRTTLNDILCSGDAVHSIVGLMSVSANMVISGICEEGLCFTESLLRTYNQGLFEDDTFSDLEGVDAAEKLLILARELGYPLHLEDIIIEPLAMRREIKSWAEVTTEFAAEDVELARRAQAAREKGCTLRYVQRIECSPPAELGGHHTHPKSKVSVSVRLEEVALDSTHAAVKGPLYHFSFHTDRYSQAPLVVQGPLSDPANTASGIVGDILRIARSVGAKDRGPVSLGKATQTATGLKY